MPRMSGRSIQGLRLLLMQRRKARRVTKGTTRRSIRVDDELWDEAQRIAKERDDNLSVILRDRLREYVEDNQEEHR
jgi:predicted DNA-binding ribbon-helix-helix protein